MQALCFFAGANSVFVGETLLTADNPGEDKDAELFARLGIEGFAGGEDASDRDTPDNAEDGRGAHACDGGCPDHARQS
jgi:biotin synthase-like enzyme